MNSYRIRRCNGNKRAWLLIHLRKDGTEIESHGGSKTSVSIDSLLEDHRHPLPSPGDKIELVLL